ncbi:MAG TPA: histidine phosphatase family protein [Pirellulales bacterium]|jgi:probable phosphoglycerate mutase|nr:histidine phosphatase family protein [Pirellulales bacterium]
MSITHQKLPTVYLARHGETEWSLSGQHTGLTDIPLTPRGEANAQALGRRLRELTVGGVLTSPLSRARRTCELAGFGERAEVDPDLVEWNYGDYEGRRTAEIRQERPGWLLFRDGCPNGESFQALTARADRVIARLRQRNASLLLFGHSHFLRMLAARWVGLTVQDARHFILSTSALSALGYEHSREEPAIQFWNDVGHLAATS